MSSLSTTGDKARHLGIGALGLVAGGIAAYFIDEVSDMALPAVGLLVVAVTLYLQHET